MTQKTIAKICVLAVAAFFCYGQNVFASTKIATPQSTVAKPYLTFGIFIGKIEEGARVFTPTRLLPFEHAEALGHEFPTALQLHEKEYAILIELGEQIGLRLQTTLQRYPRQPVQEWWYPHFSAPPVGAVKRATIRTRDAPESPIPCLKVVVFHHRFPIAFIVDTRRLSLAERQMNRATAMGLDLSRQQLLQGLKEVYVDLPPEGTVIVIFREGGENK